MDAQGGGGGGRMDAQGGGGGGMLPPYFSCDNSKSTYRIAFFVSLVHFTQSIYRFLTMDAGCALFGKISAIRCQIILTGNFRFIFPDKKIMIKLKFIGKSLNVIPLMPKYKGYFYTFHINLSQIYH